MKKEYIYTGLIALAAFAICKYTQKVFPIPIVGAYLPGGGAASA